MIKPGDVLEGDLFSEPMRVETTQTIANGSWDLGLVGVRSQRHRTGSGVLPAPPSPGRGKGALPPLVSHPLPHSLLLRHPRRASDPHPSGLREGPADGPGSPVAKEQTSPGRHVEPGCYPPRPGSRPWRIRHETSGLLLGAYGTGHPQPVGHGGGPQRPGTD
jgi:hypothetical protein